MAALCMLLASIGALAAGFTVKGTVVDSIGEGEPYATLRIFSLPDTVKAVAVATTDDSGVFSQSLKNAGDYKIVINSVGKMPLERTFEVNASRPTADLGTMVARNADAMLREVTVTAQRPLVVKEIDRIGYDVQADEDSKTSTIIEMLRKVPMVSVESDGSIKVNGQTDFRIFKNGRPNKSFSSNPKDVLSAIPASMIKKIEVITEPGAKYDAEGIGAILNIVTLEDTSIRGVMGSANLTAHSSNDMIPSNASLWLQSQIDKFTFSVNGGTGFNRRGAFTSTSESQSTYSNGNVSSSSSTSESKGNYGWFGGEASFEIDTLNLLTADFNGFMYKGSDWSNGIFAMRNAAGEPLYSYGTRGENPGNSNFDIDLSVNYQHNTHRKGEYYTLSYQLSKNSGKNHSITEYVDAYQMPVPYDKQSYESKQWLWEHTFQADWTRTFAEKHTLETGLKYIMRRNHADNYQTFGNAPEINSEYKHITDVGALYTQYSLRLGKASFRAGLRYEYSRMKSLNYDPSDPNFSSSFNDLVPSAAASWQASDASSFNFNFASRINRPGIYTLNPVHNSTPTTDSYGNPDLKSTRMYSFKLGYMYIRPKFNCNISVNYGFSNTGISNYTFVDDEGIINNTYANIGRTRQLNFSGFFQWSITPKTRWMFNGSARWNKSSQTGLSLDRWNYNFFTMLTQNLPAKFAIEAYANYFSGWAGSVYSYSESKGVSAVNYSIGLRKSLLKEDRLNLRLSISNPIGPNRRYFDSYTVNGDVTGWSRSISEPRKMVSVSVSYRFGSLNAVVKKTHKSISNDDLSSGGGSQGGGSQQGGGGAQGQ